MTQTLAVRNRGTTPIELNALVGYPYGFARTSPERVTLSGQASTEVTVDFAPPSVEAYSTWLALFTTAAPLRVQSVALLGVGTTPGKRPIADFTWDPREPIAGQAVQFEARATRAERLKWDFESDGTFDSDSFTPTHVFSSPGPYQVYLEVENAYGRDTSTQTVSVTGGDKPSVKKVERQYPGFFLQGVDFNNLFSVGVHWMGAPGKVAFSVDGGSPAWHDADTRGASHSFDMAQDFFPGFSPSRVVITPRNAAGVDGYPWTESVYVFPWPRWLEFAAGGAGVHFQFGSGEVKTLIDLQFPRIPLANGCDPARGLHDCPIRIPDWVPLLGGDFGLTETYAALDGQLSSSGKGRFRLYGQTGFAAMNRYVQGEASGEGNLLISTQKGLELVDGELELRLYGTIANDVGILELIPGLKSVAKKPILKEFNKMVRLSSQVSPRLAFSAQFAQDNGGDLAFSGAQGELGLRLAGSLYGSFFGILKASVWLAGDGSIYLALPEPILREMIVKLQAGARISIYYFFDTWRKSVTVEAGCRWSNGNGVSCGLGDAYSLAAAEEAGGVPIRLIKIDYDRFGQYSQVRPRRLSRLESSETPVNTVLTSMVTNLFPGAAPSLTSTGGGSLLLWEHQDPDAPVLQSTDIAFSLDGGSGWSAPLLINDDTRAELSPVAGPDGAGGAMAAWSRSSDPNFSQLPETLDDLAPFFRQLEIVTARFDPASQTWTQPSPLTQNNAFETDLQLAFDGNGKVWLTWLENAAGEILSTADAPSRLRYSTWNGSAWSGPATLAEGLVGVGSHAMAASSSEVVVLVPYDLDPDQAGDEGIDLYRWQGSGWSGPTTFAGADGTDNRLPSVAFDASGVAHVVWVRNGDLVHATVSDPRPQVIRENSGGLGFCDARLLASPDGHLSLVFQRETEEGPGDVFALVYDAWTASWSSDRRLTEQTDASAYDISGYFDPAGRVHLAYLNNYPDFVTETVVIDGENWDIPGIPRQGRTDLELLERSLIVDLAVDPSDLVLLPPDPDPGETVEVRCKVHNAGDFPVGSFQVSIVSYSKFGLANGVVSTLIQGIKAGDSEVVTLSFAYPSGQDSGTRFSIVVDDLNQVTEFSETNNSLRLSLENLAPVADPVASVTQGLAPLAVAFDGSTSVDPDGSVSAFEWKIPGVSGPVPGVTASFTFDQPGSYPVGLTVTDDRGRRSTSYVTVTVEPSRHYFPFYKASGQTFTGFAVSNFSNRIANLELRLFDAAGQLVSGPASAVIAPGAQLAKLGSELFQGLSGGADSGWVEMRSDNPEVGSFFLIGNGSGLDGAVDSLRYSKRLYFTRVFEGEHSFRGQAASTFLSIVNPTGSKAVVDLSLNYRLEGGSPQVARVSREIPTGGILYESVKDLFDWGVPMVGGPPTVVESPIGDGYVVVEVREGAGVVGFSMVSLNGGETIVGLGSAASETGASRLFSAQLASQRDLLYTSLRLVNISGEPRVLDLVAVSEDGTLLADTVEVTLGPGEFMQRDAADLFSFGGAALHVGSLRVEADGAGVVGDVVFGGADVRFAASMPLQGELASRAVFNQVANIPGSFFTGLALYNPQPRKADVTIEVYRADGSAAGSTAIELRPGNRISKTLMELVPESAGVIRGYVKIESSESLVLQEMFGDFNQTLLAAVPPTIIGDTHQ